MAILKALQNIYDHHAGGRFSSQSSTRLALEYEQNEMLPRNQAGLNLRAVMHVAVKVEDAPVRIVR